MKHLVHLAMLLFLFAACSQPAEKKETILAGKLTNFEGKEVTLAYYNSAKLERSEQKTEYKTKVNPDGTFEFRLDLPSDLHQIYFIAQEQRAFMALNSGDSVYLETDYSKFDEALKYSGVGAEKNTFLAKEYEEFSNSTKQRNYYGWCKLPADSMRMQLDSFYTAQKEFTEKNAQKLPNDKNFFAFMTLKNELSYLGKIINYPQINAYFTGLKDSMNVPAKDFYQPVFDLQVSKDDALLGYSFYTQFLEGYVGFLAYEPKLKYGTTIAKSEIEYETIDADKRKVAQQKLTPKAAELLVATKIFEFIKFDEVEKYTPIWKEFKTSAKSDEFKKDIVKKIAEMDSLKSQNVTSDAFKFEIVDTLGNKTTLQDFILSQKGKYVYLDLWATWCGPCIREIPHSNKVQKALEGKEVCFINLCSDKEENSDKWKKLISSKEWTGNHFMCNGDTFTTPAAKLFALAFVPRYILINPEGNIESFIAERPSGKAQEQLEKLLNK